MTKKRKSIREDIKNFTEFTKSLRETEEEQKNMSEQEKIDNAIKMGDIYY